jgi:hypothetical protein
MMSPNASVETRPTDRRSVHTVVAILLGVLTGAIAYYATVIIATAQIAGAFTVHPVVLLLLAVVAAMAVLIGWRWPTAGATAGVAMLLIIVFALVQRISWTSGTTQWLDPLDAIGFGTVSGYPAMVGAVLITASTLRAWTSHTER